MTEKTTVKCKKCGNELPPGAQFCDNCGERVAPVKKEQPATKPAAGREHAKAIAAAAGVFAVLLLITAFVFVSNRTGSAREADETETTEEQLAKMSSRVTPELYEQLDFGMSYDEVKDIIGEEGTMRYEGRYVWPGEYFDDATYVYDAPRIELEFSDSMKLIGIKEHDVLLGKEIFEAKKEGRESRVTVNEDTLAAMRNRMSYREIADILGAEGVLTEAESDKSGYDKRTYEWKYVMEGEDSSYARSLDISFYGDKARRSDWDEWGK